MLLKKTKRIEDNHEEDINQNVINTDNTDNTYKEIEKEIKSEIEKIRPYLENKTLTLDSK
jgi:hypothetical protein